MSLKNKTNKQKKRCTCHQGEMLCGVTVSVISPGIRVVVRFPGNPGELQFLEPYLGHLCPLTSAAFTLLPTKLWPQKQSGGTSLEVSWLTPCSQCKGPGLGTRSHTPKLKTQPNTHKILKKREREIKKEWVENRFLLSHFCVCMHLGAEGGKRRPAKAACQEVEGMESLQAEWQWE